MFKNLPAAFLAARSIVQWGSAEAPKTSRVDANSMYIGIVEPAWTNYDTVLADSQRVRIVFRKMGNSWSPLPHEVSSTGELDATLYPMEVHWTVVFEGKVLGSFTSMRPGKYEFYGDIGLHRPVPGSRIPKVRHGAEGFGYWMSDSRISRPLVAISVDHHEDPEGWREAVLPESIRRECDSAFRNVVEPTTSCLDSQNVDVTFSNSRMPLHMKAYGSRSRSYLVCVWMDEMDGTPCQEGWLFMQDENWDFKWFVVAEGRPKFIGSAMSLLGSGDYDDDGSSEVIFKLGGYNMDGYAIYWNDFTESTKFIWSYH